MVVCYRHWAIITITLRHTLSLAPLLRYCAWGWFHYDMLLVGHIVVIAFTNITLAWLVYYLRANTPLCQKSVGEEFATCWHDIIVDRESGRYMPLTLITYLRRLRAIINGEEVTYEHGYYVNITTFTPRRSHATAVIGIGLLWWRLPLLLPRLARLAGCREYATEECYHTMAVYVARHCNYLSRYG